MDSRPDSEFADTILASNMSFLELNEAKWLDSRYLALAKPTCRLPQTSWFWLRCSFHYKTNIKQPRFPRPTFSTAHPEKQETIRVDLPLQMECQGRVLPLFPYNKFLRKVLSRGSPFLVSLCHLNFGHMPYIERPKPRIWSLEDWASGKVFIEQSNRHNFPKPCQQVVSKVGKWSCTLE